MTGYNAGKQLSAVVDCESDRHGPKGKLGPLPSQSLKAAAIVLAGSRERLTGQPKLFGGDGGM